MSIQKMMQYYCRTILAALCLSTLFLGCEKNPLTDPYCYTSSTNEDTWQLSRKEKKRIQNVILTNIIDLKDSTETYSLGELFDVSLQYNPKTSETWQKAREAAAMYGASLSSYFPQVSLEAAVNSVRAGFIFQGESLIVNEQTAYGPLVNLSYLIWDGGQSRANIDSFYQTLQGANLDHNQQIQTVLKDTANAYYNYLYAKSYLNALRSDLLDTEATYEAATLKLSSGVFSSTDMLQAKTNYLKAKIETTAQETKVKNAYIELLKTLGIPDEKQLSIGCFPEAIPPSPFDLEKEKLVALAKKFRPDYLSAKTAVLASEASIRKAKAELMPKLNLQASGGTYWYTGGVNDEGNYNILLSFQIPIFTGFYNLNQIRAEESELKTAVAVLRSKEVSISGEVRSYANNHEMALQQVQETKDYLEAAEIEFDAMIKRYRQGIVTILDVLSSQAFLSDARAQYIDAQKLFYESLIDIAFATGLLTNNCPLNLEGNE